jgi:hypothetical protein
MGKAMKNPWTDTGEGIPDTGKKAGGAVRT